MQNVRYFKEVKSLELLKKAYREWALKLHPDRGGNEEAFKEMLSEYERVQTDLSTPAEPKWTKEVDAFDHKWRKMTWRRNKKGNLWATVGNAYLLIFEKRGKYKGLITVDETEKYWINGKYSWDFETENEVKQAIYHKINDLICEKYAGC